MAMNLGALKQRDFRLYILGNIFALQGLWIQRITIGWLAWNLTGSASFVGLVAFVNYAPTLFVGPLFGVLTDRVRLKPAAVLVQACQLMIATGLFAGFAAGWLGTTLLLVVALASGFAAAAYNPIRMSLAPRLVPREHVASVVTLVAINFNLARLSGPAIGGVLIATSGVGTTLAVQALCYIPFTLALLFLHPRESRQNEADPTSFLRAFSDGILHVWKTVLIRNAILITGIFAFTIRGVLEVLPVVADGVFEQGAVGLGLLTSAGGAGALVAGFSKALRPAQIEGHLPGWALAVVLFGLTTTAALGFVTFWPLAVGLVAVLGFAASFSGITLQTAIQMELPDELRGRVMSLWVMFAIGASAMGALVLGRLIDLVGFRAALSSTGLLAMLAMLPFLLARRKRRF